MQSQTDSNMTTETISINRRFRGPPTSGHGGYVSGLLASYLIDTAIEVTLKAPVPLETNLQIRIQESAELYSNDHSIAVAQPVQALSLSIPPVSMTDAIAASSRHSAFYSDGENQCFGCGPDRSEEDGLCIYVGPVEEGRRGGVVATPWRPDSSLVGADGIHLSTEFIWSCLDCPGAVTSRDVRPDSTEIVLGRMTVQVLSPPTIESELIVMGWLIEASGRKYHAGTAILDDQGAPLAVAQQIWIALRNTDEVNP